MSSGGPDFSSMFHGAAGDISASLRHALWQSYLRNSSNVSGVTDPALLVAKQLRQEGVVFDTEDKFGEFLRDYGQSTQGKTGVDRYAALEQLVSRYAMGESAEKLATSLASNETPRVADAVQRMEPADTGPTSYSPEVSAALGNEPEPTSTALVPLSGGSSPPSVGGGSGGGGLAPPGGGGNIARSGSSGGGEDTRTALEQIRDAVRMLVVVNIKAAEDAKKPGAGEADKKPEKPEEEKRTGLYDVLNDAFGDAPSTHLGRFGQRINRLGGKVRARIKKFRKYRSGGKAAESDAGAASKAAGAGRAAAGAEAGAGEAAAGELAAGSAAGPVGIGVAAAMIFATAVVEFGKATYAFARGQEADMRRLAGVGGAQAAAAAQLDANRTQRDVKTAAETGGSSQSLADSINRFEDKLRPIESLITNISNTVAGRLLDIASGVLDAIKPGVAIVQKIYDVLPWSKKINEPVPMWDVMKEIAEKQEKLANPKFPMGGPGPGPRGGSVGYDRTI